MSDPSLSRFTGAVLVAVAINAAEPVQAAQPTGNAIQRMLEAGPEQRLLGQRVGSWALTITLHPDPDDKAAPIVWKGLRADRQMIGGFMEEVIRPLDTSGGDWRRISYVHYNRVEGRWQYVSMDTRFPAGIMPAYGNPTGRPDTIKLDFEPIAFPGFAAAVDGWMLRSDYEAINLGSDHETARQHWVRADGTGRRWLGVEYDYRRIPTGR